VSETIIERRMRRPSISTARRTTILSRAGGNRGSAPEDPSDDRFESWDDDATRDDDNEPLFPSLKRRSASERASEVVDALKKAILNPGRIDGGSGMAYRDWSRVAQKKITRAISEAEASVALREMMSAHRIGGLCLRIGFLLLAAVASFTAFWFGIVFVWEVYGPAWGLGAAMSALGLSLSFVVAGLSLSGDDIDKIREKVREKLNLAP